jgi:iron complex outermembrane receptor protein
MHQRTKIAVAVALALNTLTAFAQAQAEAEAPQRVEITGSRIRQVDLETAQPILKMTAQQIQASGLVTVGDVLNQLTSAGPPAFSKGATLTSNREQGGQYIDMRNLGSQRLLVLVNGKRWSTTVAGYTDMSTIPTSMIDRIEILKDGASAIYGSDAIAGVINIILKKSMNGGSFSVYKGINEKGDGKNSDYDISYGGGDEKASLMFGLSHTTSGVVWTKDRDVTATSYTNHPTAGLGVGEWGRIRKVSSTGAATGINQYLNHTGTWQNPNGVGADSRKQSSYHAYTGAVDDLYNSTQQMQFQSPTELTTMFTKGEIQLPWDLRFKSTAMFSERSSTRQNAGYPVNSLSQAKYPVYIDKNSYYNPYGASATGGAGEDLFFYRRVVEMPRITESKNQTVHIDATIEGDFTIAGKPWGWSAGYNHSAVTGQSNSSGNINLVNLKKAVGPSFLNGDGVVQCGTAAAPIGLSECTPFNILGGPSASSAAALKYVGTTGQATYGSTVNSATADINGELFNLPAGAVGFAGGAEYREVRGYDVPDQFAAANLTTDLAYNATYGRYTVKEAYLEANVPLLKDMPFAKLLSLDLATRYSDYSNFGTTTNSKVSFMWKPVNDLLTRGTWAEGFRAPSLADTFGGGSQTFDTYLDVCDSKYGSISNATVMANCRAAGVPVTFRQKGAAGNDVLAAAQTPTPFNSSAGNADLRPETAKTKTLGLVYSPSYVPGLTASLDWFDITVENRITAVSASFVLNECYLRSNASFCKNITRDSTGQIIGLTRGNANLGTLQTEGMDLGLNYRLPRTPYGQFNIRSESTWLKSYRSKASADAQWAEYAGDYGINRLKSNLSIDWSLGNWASTLTMRYSSGVKDDCWSSTEECSNPDGESAGYGPYNKIGSVTYTDLNVSYATPWKGKISVGSNNLFNKTPRSIYSGDSSGSSVDPNLPIDRFVYVRYTQAF